jgi:hypothetical protein
MYGKLYDEWLKKNLEPHDCRKALLQSHRIDVLEPEMHTQICQYN